MLHRFQIISKAEQVLLAVRRSSYNCLSQRGTLKLRERYRRLVSMLQSQEQGVSFIPQLGDEKVDIRYPIKASLQFLKHLGQRCFV